MRSPLARSYREGAVALLLTVALGALPGFAAAVIIRSYTPASLMPRR